MHCNCASHRSSKLVVFFFSFHFSTFHLLANEISSTFCNPKISIHMLRGCAVRALRPRGKGTRTIYYLHATLPAHAWRVWRAGVGPFTIFIHALPIAIEHPFDPHSGHRSAKQMDSTIIKVRCPGLVCAWTSWSVVWGL